MLVFDVQARFHPVGDDARPVAVAGRRRAAGDPPWKEQANAIRSAEIQVLANHGFEKVAALHRAIEDLRQTHFELTNRHAMIVAGGAVRRGHRPGEAMRPAVEEGLDVGGAQGIAGGLQRRTIRTRQKPVIETLEGDVITTKTLLDPLVPVETQLDRIRKVGANLEERRVSALT